MKDIKNYDAAKYEKEPGKFKRIEEGIYECEEDGDIIYVTSLSFVQEPEFEEGEFAGEISQYPLEDILDEFYCHISDFYEELNLSDSKTCYLEFGAMDLEDIVSLRGIIGKHVYNAEYEKDGQVYIKLVIE